MKEIESVTAGYGFSTAETMAGFEVLTAVMKGSTLWVPEDGTIQQKLLATPAKEKKLDILKNGPSSKKNSRNTITRKFKSKFTKYFSFKTSGLAEKDFLLTTAANCPIL